MKSQWQREILTEVIRLEHSKCRLPKHQQSKTHHSQPIKTRNRIHCSYRQQLHISNDTETLCQLDEQTCATSAIWLLYNTNNNNYYYYTCVHLFNGLFFRTSWVSQYQKGKTSLGLNEARDNEVLGCSGIGLTICKQSALLPRQITTLGMLHYGPFTPYCRAALRSIGAWP